MYGVFGVYFVEKINENKAEKLSRVFVNSFDNGKKIWGLFSISREGKVYNMKGQEVPDVYIVKDFLIRSNPKIIIGNNSTMLRMKHCKGDTLDTIPPYYYQDWIISYFGRDPNYKMLGNKYGVVLKDKLHVTVLPLAFDNIGSYTGIAKMLREEFKTPYVLLFTNVKDDKLCVYTINKHVYIHRDITNRYYVVTSLKKYYNNKKGDNIKTRYVKNSTLLCMNTDGIEEYNS